MKTAQTMLCYLKESIKDENQAKIVYFGKEFTAKEMLMQIENVAAFLKGAGVKKGDSVGIALPNMPEAVFAFYAINALGAVANVLHPLLSPERLKQNLKFTNTRVIFIYDKLYNNAKDVFDKNDNLIFVVCTVSHFIKAPLIKFLVKRKEQKIDGKDAILYKNLKTACLKNDGFCQSETKLAKARSGKESENCEGRILKYVTREAAELDTASTRFCNCDGSEPAVYLHSGGTTGEAKTVVLNSAALNEMAESLDESVYKGGSEGDSMLMVLPIFHSFGLAVPMHTALTRNCKVVILPKFNAAFSLKFIKTHKITHLAVVPAMLARMFKHKKFKGDFSFVKYIFCGGDTLPSQIETEFNKKLAKLGSSCLISQGFGLSEVSAVFSVNRKGAVKEGSLGKPLCGNEAFAADENGNKLPAGECGELYLNSKSLMLGYLNDEAATQNALVQHDGKTWLKTGDLGTVDADGFIFFKERIKRSVKISAVNIFPLEVETVANELSEIESSCAARAYEDEKAHIALFVKLNKNHVLDEKLQQKIKDEILKALGGYAVPKQIIATNKIYLTPYGKVDFLKHEEQLKTENLLNI
jgi:long-chain acyl-CoA synthetase